MNAAPLIERAPLGDPVTHPYHKWVEHYNSCVTCQSDDWFSPILGEASLCEKGKQLFRAWVKAAALNPDSPRKRRARG